MFDFSHDFLNFCCQSNLRVEVMSLLFLSGEIVVLMMEKLVSSPSFSSFLFFILTFFVISLLLIAIDYNMYT